MEFLILGPLAVEDDGRTIPLAGAKQRALLALLLLGRGRPVSTDRLIEEIWNGKPPETALKSVQTIIYPAVKSPTRDHGATARFHTIVA